MSSRALPMRLVPLSLTISRGEPLLAMNRHFARIQEAVASEWASSMCIAPTTTSIGPKESSPVCVKAL